MPPLYRFALTVRKLEKRLRGLFWSSYIRFFGGKCGRRLRVDRRIHFKYPPHAGICIGDDVAIGRDITIDVPIGGVLVIGNEVKLTMSTIIAAVRSVEIGNNTQIAEFVSIRDSDHGTGGGQLIAEQPLVCNPISIGQDVWIGRGVAILKGACIGTGAVIGANAVVKGEISGNTIAVGIPARVIKRRQ